MDGYVSVSLYIPEPSPGFVRTVDSTDQMMVEQNVSLVLQIDPYLADPPLGLDPIQGGLLSHVSPRGCGIWPWEEQKPGLKVCKCLLQGAS